MEELDDSMDEERTISDVVDDKQIYVDVELHHPLPDSKPVKIGSTKTVPPKPDGKLKNVEAYRCIPETTSAELYGQPGLIPATASNFSSGLIPATVSDFTDSGLLSTPHVNSGPIRTNDLSVVVNLCETPPVLSSTEDKEALKEIQKYQHAYAPGEGEFPLKSQDDIPKDLNEEAIFEKSPAHSPVKNSHFMPTNPSPGNTSRCCTYAYDQSKANVDCVKHSGLHSSSSGALTAHNDNMNTHGYTNDNRPDDCQVKQTWSKRCPPNSPGNNQYQTNNATMTLGNTSVASNTESYASVYYPTASSPDQISWVWSDSSTSLLHDTYLTTANHSPRRTWSQEPCPTEENEYELIHDQSLSHYSGENEKSKRFRALKRRLKRRRICLFTAVAGLVVSCLLFFAVLGILHLFGIHVHLVTVEDPDESHEVADHASESTEVGTERPIRFVLTSDSGNELEQHTSSMPSTIASSTNDLTTKDHNPPTAKPAEKLTSDQLVCRISEVISIRCNTRVAKSEDTLKEQGEECAMSQGFVINKGTYDCGCIICHRNQMFDSCLAEIGVNTIYECDHE